MFLPFNQLPPTARVWVYQANRNFTAAEEEALAEQLTSFCQQWKAHGADLNSSFLLKYNRFVVLGVDESANMASGCSIDASVNKLKQLEAMFGLNFMDRTQVAFLKNDELFIEPLPRVKAKVAEGKITADTPTFNNLVATVDEFKSSWIIPAKVSWLKRYF